MARTKKTVGSEVTEESLEQAKHVVQYNELVGTERIGAVAHKDFDNKKEAEKFAEAVSGRLV